MPHLRRCTVLAALIAAVIVPSASHASHSEIELLSRGPASDGQFTVASAAASPGSAVSADASRVYFISSERHVPEDVDGEVDVYERSNGGTRLVSTGAAGGNNSGFVGIVDVSDDGARVFFTTSEHLVPEDTDLRSDIYVGTTDGVELVTAGQPDGHLGFFTSEFNISADGSRAFFVTEQRMVPQDTDAKFDIYLRHAGETTLVTPGTMLDTPRLFGPHRPVMVSDDGEHVFFESLEGLTADDLDGSSAIDVYEWHAGSVRLVSTGPGDSASWPHRTSRDMLLGGISDDGARVFFETHVPLTADDTALCHYTFPGESEDASCRDVFERSGGVTRRISISETEHAGDATFEGASPDGSHVFFRSLTPFTTDDQEVGCSAEACADLYERLGSDTRLVSTGPTDTQTHPPSSRPNARFSGTTQDGNHVYFTSVVRLVAADTDDCSDIYARAAGVTRLITAGSSDPSCPNHEFSFNHASTDGSRVFFSTGSYMTPDDTDFGCTEFDAEEEVSFEVPCWDVYEWHDGQVTLLSTGPNSPAGPYQAVFHGSSRDGRVVVVTTDDPFLAEDTDGPCPSGDPGFSVPGCFDVYRLSVPPDPPQCDAVTSDLGDALAGQQALPDV